MVKSPTIYSLEIASPIPKQKGEANGPALKLLYPGQAYSPAASSAWATMTSACFIEAWSINLPL